MTRPVTAGLAAAAAVLASALIGIGPAGAVGSNGGSSDGPVPGATAPADGAPGATAPGAPASQSPTANTVSVSVLSITPNTPGAAAAAAALTIVVRLTNTGAGTLDHLSLRVDRGDPIGGVNAQQAQAALDSAIAHPQPPDPAEDSPLKDATGAPLTVAAGLTPHGSTTVTVQTSSSLVNDQGLCICAVAAIYPLWFSVHYDDPQGNDTVIGTGQSYVPAFYQAPKPVQVSWLWPIVEAPHRLGSGDVFLDDGLATEVTTGRLAHLLQVADTVTRTMPMTLVLDPELIDELVVMSTGSYQVKSGPGPPLAGTGGPAAAAWLTELRAVIHRPGVELDFTAPADPDVQTLVNRGLDWQSQLPEAQQAEVNAALGVNTDNTDVVWPVGESLDSLALTALAQRGASTVVLNQAALPGGTAEQTSLDALAPLGTSAGDLTAAVTSNDIEKYVAPVLSEHGAGLAQLPELVAEVAIRAVEQPTATHYVVITPPRNVDPDPVVAAQAILATTHTYWSQALPLGKATTTISPVDHGTLSPAAGGAAGLPDDLIADVQNLLTLQPALTGMVGATTAETELSWIPGVVQNLESTAWRADPDQGEARAAAALDQLSGIRSGVYIVQPSSSDYTFGSHNSPLPLTIENDLDYPVTISLSVRTAVPDLPGFSARSVQSITIAGNKTRQVIKVSTHTDRTGRFQIQAVLLTPNLQVPLDVVPLTVHSTALGTIGIIITIVAGAVLALALLVRLVRRLLRRGSKPPKPKQPKGPEPVGAGTS